MATARSRSRQPVRIGRTEEELLFGLGRYLFLTADQATRRAYSANSKRFVQKRLAELAEAGFVERHLGYPQSGKPPTVFSLSSTGWRYVEEHLGQEAPQRWRPSEGIHGFTRYLHDMAVADFGIAVERLCRLGFPTVRLVRFVHDRFLPQTMVQLPDGSKQGMRLDAFVELRILRGDPPRPRKRCLALELDRSSHYQVAFRRKVAALLAYVEGGHYEQQFGTASLTYLVVCPGDPERAGQLLKWIEAELREQKAPDAGSIFLVTAADPAKADLADLAELFTGRCWRRPFSPEPVSLLAFTPEPTAIRLDKPRYLSPEDYDHFLTAIGEPASQVVAEQDAD